MVCTVPQITINSMQLPENMFLDCNLYGVVRCFKAGLYANWDPKIYVSRVVTKTARRSTSNL